MDFGKCAACRRKFQKRSYSSDQRYCSARKCQLKRRQRWHTNKKRKDLAYRDDQMRMHNEWARLNPNYWIEYRRAKRKNYETNSEARQIESENCIEKMDASLIKTPLLSALCEPKID